MKDSRELLSIGPASVLGPLACPVGAPVGMACGTPLAAGVGVCAGGPADAVEAAGFSESIRLPNGFVRSSSVGRKSVSGFGCCCAGDGAGAGCAGASLARGIATALLDPDGSEASVSAWGAVRSSIVGSAAVACRNVSAALVAACRTGSTTESCTAWRIGRVSSSACCWKSETMLRPASRKSSSRLRCCKSSEIQPGIRPSPRSSPALQPARSVPRSSHRPP
jgi:hypothetical protein